MKYHQVFCQRNNYNTGQCDNSKVKKRIDINKGESVKISYQE